ncbi:MAG: GtrA family protein [Minisyncoccia bacterium]
MSVPTLVALLITRLAHFVRFSLSGLIATGVNYGLLSIFIGVLGGISAATLAFALSTGVNFLLQKFWAYREPSREQMRRQLVLYALAGLLMLGINDSTFWALADIVKLNYVIAQLVATALVAVVGLEATRRIFTPAVQRIRP